MESNDDVEGSGSIVAKKPGNEKKTTKRRKLRSSSIGRNLKVNEMLKKKKPKMKLREKSMKKPMLKLKKRKRLSEIEDNDVNVNETTEANQTDNEEDAEETNDRKRKGTSTSKGKKMKTVEEQEKNIGSDEEDRGSESENEGLFVAKEKNPAKMKKKTQASTSESKKLRSNESEEEDYMESEKEEEGKKLKKVKKEREEEDPKPSKTMTYLTCNTRSSPKSLYEGMSGLSEDRKRCLKEIWFEGYIHFSITELPSTMAYHVIENFHAPSTKLRLQKGSIKATRQKVHDILGIPMGKMKLEDLEQRPYNDHLGKPTPPTIALQISVIRSWNTLLMRKWITIETRKRCLGNLEHYEEFDPKKEQTDIDLYKGLDVYIEPLNDRKPVTKEEKENIDDIGKGKGEGGCELKDDGVDVQDDVNNEPEFEKVIGDDKEVAASLDVDNKNEEIIKEKDGNETEDNEKINKNEMKNGYNSERTTSRN
uniref:Uncharacterized protein n=1 Tax=Tanacetum cinerariifolium TaxID=118510 RepID=A0A6L2KG35_TANCI|nr:hypothetical protein [Tanacetum cinerariifolium]